MTNADTYQSTNATQRECVLHTCMANATGRQDGIAARASYANGNISTGCTSVTSASGLETSMCTVVKYATCTHGGTDAFVSDANGCVPTVDAYCKTAKIAQNKDCGNIGTQYIYEGRRLYQHYKPNKNSVTPRLYIFNMQHIQAKETQCAVANAVDVMNTAQYHVCTPKYFMKSNIRK